MGCTNPQQNARGYPVPRWGPGPFCVRDTQVIADVLAELPHLYVELYIELGHSGSGSRDVQVSGTRDHTVPLRLGVDALMRDTCQVILSWLELTCTVAGLREVDTQRKVRTGAALMDGCDTLRQHLNILLTLGPHALIRDNAVVELTGTQAGLELLHLRQRAHALLGKVPYVETRSAPCPACGAYALTREAGSNVTTCEICADRLDEVTYDRWVLALLAGHDG